MRFSLAVTFVFFANLGIAQERLFSGSFENEPFLEFIEKFEESTGFKVYFKVADFETFTVTSEFRLLSPSQMFEKIFSNTQYYYVIDKRGNIFLTSEHFIQSELPLNFFDSDQTLSDRSPVFLVTTSDSDSVAEKRVHLIGRVSKGDKTGNAMVSGKVTGSSTRQPIAGATIFCRALNKGAVADPNGAYSLLLPKGDFVVEISAVGMVTTTRKISVYGDGTLDIHMHEEVKMLKEMVVRSDRDVNVTGVQMGLQKLDIKSLKKFAAPMGEVDILRVVLSLPGVQSVGEASTGLNVRGGSASQNLILYNDAVVYNPAHLFGFFTAFNPDEIQSVEVQKGTFPVEYGGRLSSVIDSKSKEGDKKKLVGTGGIGLLTGRFTLEGPIKSEKTSFLIGGRSSYSNWLLHKIPNESLNNSLASFYDLNLNVVHKVNATNNFTLSTYWSSDKFRLNDDSLYTYTNSATSLKWKHIFSSQMSGSFVLTNSRYGYGVSSDENPTEAFELSYKTNQYDLKADFDLTVSTHNLTLGFNSTVYDIRPGQLVPIGDSSIVSKDYIGQELAAENALFVGDNFEVNSRLSIYAGLRYSFFSALGPRKVVQYANDIPKSEDSIVDTLYIGRFKSSAFYHGPEYRASLRFAITPDLSIKASYNLMRQYLQILSNTTAISPTDVWKLSDQHVKPQIGNQVSVGLFKNYKEGTYELSVETYYKRMKNILDYRDGANLTMNHTIEADVLNANGLSFGTELMLKKNNGRLNGWVSYVFSRSFLKTRSQFSSETVNGGNYYPSNYDKPHAVNLTGNYRVSHRFGVSLNATYSTGRPITLPLAKYELEEAMRLLYSQRNQYRVPDYFRIDVGLNVEGNHKVKKLAHSSWTFGVYNLTGRNNIYSVFFRANGSTITGYKMSIFGAPIPSVTYNFRF